MFNSVLAAGILHYTEFGFNSFYSVFLVAQEDTMERFYVVSQPAHLFLDFVEILLCTCSISPLIFLLYSFAFTSLTLG